MAELEKIPGLLTAGTKRLDAELEELLFGPSSAFAKLVSQCFEKYDENARELLLEIVNGVIEKHAENEKRFPLFASRNPIEWETLPQLQEADETQIGKIHFRDATLGHQEETCAQATRMLENLRDALMLQPTSRDDESAITGLTPNDSIESDATKLSSLGSLSLESFDALHRTHDGYQQAQVKVPILLVTLKDYDVHAGERFRGAVADLEVTKVNGPAKKRGHFLKLGSLGFSGLTVDQSSGEYPAIPSGFGSGVDRAWQACRFPIDSAPHLRWALHQRADNRIFFERFEDRSCEAAFACGFWAAAGVHADGSALVDELDPKAAVTAQLDEETLGGPETTLKKIAGLREKVEAAKRAGIDLIVVAEQQSSIDDIDDLREEFGIEIVPVGTLGEAFDELISSSRIMRKYREEIEDAWLDQWAKDANGVSTGIWSEARDHVSSADGQSNG